MQPAVPASKFTEALERAKRQQDTARQLGETLRAEAAEKAQASAPESAPR